MGKTAKNTKNNSWENLEGFRYAHRGYFDEPLSASKKPVRGKAPRWKMDVERIRSRGEAVIPENSMPAFERAVSCGFGAELDVHVAMDGGLFVVHDSDLLRMTGQSLIVENMTSEELRSMRLLGTDIRIPELEEVLQLFTSEKARTSRADAREGREGSLCLPLIIELKVLNEKDIDRLCRGVMAAVDRYVDLNYCVESFDPRAVLWFRKFRPEVIRGQLTEDYTKNKTYVEQYGKIKCWLMWGAVTDAGTWPDFVACRFQDRKNPLLRISRMRGVKQVSWTIHSQEEMDQIDREGGLSIFERFLPAPPPG